MRNGWRVEVLFSDQDETPQINVIRYTGGEVVEMIAGWPPDGSNDLLVAADALIKRARLTLF